MRVGFRMRLQAMAAVQAKVLRLNSAAIADVTSGKVRPDAAVLPRGPCWQCQVPNYLILTLRSAGGQPGQQ